MGDLIPLRPQPLQALLESARRPCVAVVGTFDGVHHGHRELLHNARRLATSPCLSTIALTMDPRPDVLFAPDRALPNVCTLAERIRRLREAGADDVVVIPFTRETAALTYVEFCALLTEHLEMRSLYVGEDFAVGSRRAGTPTRLRELGLDVWTNPLVPSADGTGKASSTNVRMAIALGADPELALAAA